jgi:hypothetical protein
MNEQDIINQYQAEIQLAQSQAQQSQSNPYAPAMFGNQQKQNLIELELDFKPELESIERLLRCDIIVKDKEGNEVWAENPDKSKVFFNELGVNDFLRNLVVIVNKNKVLANYNMEEINSRVQQIKHEIRVLIYNNYEQYGMDNEYKMNNYSMIVLAVGSVIEDAYRRAMNGEAHRGLSETRLVTQNEQMIPQGYPMMMPQQKKGILSRLNPLNWGKS